MQSLLERNLESVLADVAAAAADAGRDPAEVQLVAVTKTVTPEVAAELAALGARELGESRVDVLEAKHAYFAERDLAATWHFVGHLQRNKAARAVRVADVVHSVDSLALLDAIDRHAGVCAKRVGVYLQVLLSEEESKHGFDPNTLVEAVDRVAERDHVDLLGLMTMAPLADDEPEKLARAREVFERLADIALELPALAFTGGQPRLSMGMSGDFREAVAVGADVVRIGSALFEGLPQGAPGP